MGRSQRVWVAIFRLCLTEIRSCSADYYFDSYSHFGIHEEMLKDEVKGSNLRIKQCNYAFADGFCAFFGFERCARGATRTPSSTTSTCSITRSCSTSAAEPVRPVRRLHSIRGV